MNQTEWALHIFHWRYAVECRSRGKVQKLLRSVFNGILRRLRGRISCNLKREGVTSVACDRYFELLSARLDGALTQSEERELEEHMANCPECRTVGAQLPPQTVPEEPPPAAANRAVGPAHGW